MQKITGDERDALSELCEVFAGRAQHVLGEIHADNAALRERLEQLRSQSSSATTGVEHALVAAEPEPRQNLLAPAHLGPGQAVVNR